MKIFLVAIALLIAGCASNPSELPREPPKMPGTELCPDGEDGAFPCQIIYP